MCLECAWSVPGVCLEWHASETYVITLERRGNYHPLWETTQSLGAPGSTGVTREPGRSQSRGASLLPRVKCPAENRLERIVGKI